MKRFTFINQRYEAKQLGLSGGKRATFAVFKDKDFSDHDFSERTLNNIIFVRCNFINSNFSDITAENLKFYSCNLDGTNFSHSKIRNLVMSKSTTISANFDEAILDTPIFYHSTHTHSTFTASIIANLHGQYCNLDQIDFTKAAITGTFVLIGNFRGTDAEPSAGFRTKKGGGQSWVVPVCSKKCITDSAFCRQDCKCNTNPDKFNLPGGDK
jgi:uncharacterized protein YjbI with pentapeptide repeats